MNKEKKIIQKLLEISEDINNISKRLPIIVHNLKEISELLLEE